MKGSILQVDNGISVIPKRFQFRPQLVIAELLVSVLVGLSKDLVRFLQHRHNVELEPVELRLRRHAEARRAHLRPVDHRHQLLALWRPGGELRKCSRSLCAFFRSLKEAAAQEDPYLYTDKAGHFHLICT